MPLADLFEIVPPFKLGGLPQGLFKKNPPEFRGYCFFSRLKMNQTLK